MGCGLEGACSACSTPWFRVVSTLISVTSQLVILSAESGQLKRELKHFTAPLHVDAQRSVRAVGASLLVFALRLVC
jgi:hypothetical protein